MKTTNKRNDSNFSRENVQNPYRNPHERILKVTEKRKGKLRRFFAIRDCEFRCWRGTKALDEHDAWTRDIARRAEFATRAAANRALEAIWNWRQAQSDQGKFFTNPFTQGVAA